MKDNVYALVEESVGHYWDQVANGNIPGCLVAVTMVWTKVNHVDIGKWYQGIAEMNTPNSSGASRTKKKAVIMLQMPKTSLKAWKMTIN